MKIEDELRDKIERLSKLDIGLLSSDFLLTWRRSEDEVRFILLAAEILEDLTRAGMPTRFFDRGLGLSIFRDKSMHTIYAFKSACNLLGLITDECDANTSRIATGESVRETAATIGFLTEVIGIRDDLYPQESHLYMTEMAASLAEAFANGILPARPSIVNLQSDLDHPTQSLSDLCYLAKKFRALGGLRGKRMAISWAYSPTYAKPLSVPQGLVALMTRFGLDVVLAHPPGYDLMDEPLSMARQHATSSGGSFKVVHSMDAAFADADIIYPVNWTPVGVMRERTHLLRVGKSDRIATLEQEALAQNARFQQWECNEHLMALTRGGDGLYMHGLPTDVSHLNCTAGEVSQRVFERTRIETYRQAANKPFVIAAMILATRVKNPATMLARMLDARDPHRR